MMSTGDNEDGTQATIGLPGASAAPGDAGQMTGTCIGPYRLVSLLGRGGMGEVYVAEQDEPVRRTVALKLLRERHLDTRRLAHFEVERQLLAQMRHPAIAQIFDAGTSADGRPYSAMELIDGLPVSRHCTQAKLPLRARIELFVRICEGVQHAHQKGVVHRDLKPGNILVAEVDGRALPKIIDFGIASMGSGKGGGSSDSGGLGTPAYMSPEQASAPDSVDTRSDIYSLGVLLHELLCGRRPVRGDAHAFRPSQALAALPQDEQARVAADMGLGVAQLRRVLANELDWVVARATAADRADRYASVNELAADLRRFLDGQPLLAVPASRGYRWRKFAGRNRGVLAVGGIVLLALTGGLGMSLYGLGQARTQQALAEERARQLEAVSGFQQSMLEGIDIESMGLGLASALRTQIARSAPQEAVALERVLAHAGTADIARELVGGSILERAGAAIERDFGDQPGVAADLGESMARVWQALGMHDDAAAAFGKVADARAQWLGAQARPTLGARNEQISELLLGGREQRQVALELQAQVRGDFETLDEGDPLRILFQMDVIIAEAANDQRARHERLEALLAQARRRPGERDPATLAVANAGAILLARLGDLKEARERLETLVPLNMEVLGESHPETLSVKQNLAVARILSGDSEGAIAMQRELADFHERKYGAEHPTTLMMRGNLANVLSDSGRREEAVPLAQAVYEASLRTYGAEHLQALRSKLNLSSIIARVGRHDEALALQLDVIEARMRLLGPTHPDTLFIRVNRPATLHQAGRSDEALALMADVLPLTQRTLGESHPTTQMAMDIRAMIAEETGRTALELESRRALLDWRMQAQGANELNTVTAAWKLEKALRRAGNQREADQVHASYIQPLLDTPEDELSPGQRRLVETIRE